MFPFSVEGSLKLNLVFSFFMFFFKKNFFAGFCFCFFVFALAGCS
jgi:hypothetical protein